MYNKIKSCLVDILSFTSTFFTFFIVAEVAIKIIDKNNSVRVYTLVSSFTICLLISIACYIIWYTRLLQSFSYRIKNVVQYLFGLVLMIIANDLSSIARVIFAFVYYNFLYFSLSYIFTCKNRRDVEKLNKVIMKLKEEKDE